MTQATIESAKPEGRSDAGANGSAKPVVAVQGLSKTFRDFWMRPRARAVADVTFEIRPHEIFGLLGPNGGGKTTLFRILSTLLPPQSGRARILGADLLAERQ
ncbi:MAG: ATP-binding cassette domain-containing protein, partial [Phycisphaerales bacterium]|nr:ATP-binding cassette domain-containing protein [Phycisphaerales bacterium]